MTTPWWSARTIAACALLTLALTGCTTGGSTPTGSSGTSSTAGPATRTPAPTAEPEAVIVVASVDADGKAVTTTGYVSGIIEDGGSCAFRLTPQGEGAGVTTTTTGQADRSTTSCGQGVTPIGELSRGSWNVVLTYTSVSQRTVVSQPVSVEIP